MMAKVVRLRPKAERVCQDVAQQIASSLALFPKEMLPEYPREALLNALHGITEPDDSPVWPGGYNMLSKRQTAAIWDAIRELPGKDRPHLVRHAFDLVLLNLRPDTGEVTLTRDEMAERMKCASPHVSRAMGVLERMGIITRARRRIGGLRGPGMAVYMVNPHVAWNGRLEARQEAARNMPQPRLALVPVG